jgi:cytochrome P450
MIEASGEECDSDEEKETSEPPAECPAHKATATKTAVAKGVMTDKEVYTNAAEFLIAGNDTTSICILLSYTTYLLALNPDIQEKLQSEIDAYFEDEPVRQSVYNTTICIMMACTTVLLLVIRISTASDHHYKYKD